jgi:hypothetical protein
MRPLDTSIDLTFPDKHTCPGVDSASNRNEYQESSGGVKNLQSACEADNLTAIREPIV